MKKEPKYYDKRVVERYVQKNDVTRNDFKDYIKNLPDETPNAVFVQLDLHDTELDEGSLGAEHADDSVEVS